jgi:nicotinamide N-methyltransferase
MLLPSLITLRHLSSHIPTPEDIFGSTLGSIFTDDLQNQHGDDPDTTIVYASSIHGDLEFRTADVNGEEQRRKFAHYLWNAGVLVGELVGGRPEYEETGDREREENLGEGGWWMGKEEGEKWNVKGEKVLELGAGALG